MNFVLDFQAKLDHNRIVIFALAACDSIFYGVHLFARNALNLSYKRRLRHVRFPTFKGTL